MQGVASIWRVRSQELVEIERKLRMGFVALSSYNIFVGDGYVKPVGAGHILDCIL